MSSEWKTLSLGKLGRVVTGKTPKTADDSNFGGEIPFVTPTDMDGRKEIRYTARYLSESGALTVRNLLIPAGSVMVSCIGSDMGKAVIAGRACVTNQQINSIVVDSKFSSEFVYYNLSMRKTELQHLASGGSTMPILNKGNFSEVKIDLPCLSEQQLIAGFLSVLDSRITLLRETNATLEAIAQAIFKSWFVDFDPVRAKQEGRAPEGDAQGSASDAGGRMPIASMDEATAALFPDSFEESELGLVPGGWRVGCLADIAKTSKKSMTTADFHDGINYVGLEHIPRKSLSLSEWGDAGGLESNKSAFAKGDVLFGKLRPYFHKVVVAPISGVCSTDILVCQPTQPEYHGVVTMHLFSDALISYADRLSNGAKMPRVNWGDLAQFPITVPPVAISKSYAEVIAPLLSRMSHNTLKAQTLATLRDTLLPRLISGKLRLPEAEALIEEST